MEESLYQVIITGRILEPVLPWQAIFSFANLLSITHEEALIRFDQAPCRVRGSLSREHAEKYCRVLQRQGIQCELRQDSLEIRSLGAYPRLSQPG